MGTVFSSFGFSLAAGSPSVTPLAMTSYDPVLSRVRVDVAAIAATETFPAGATVTVERSTDLRHWTTVRGGVSVTLTDYTHSVDDYEFTDAAVNHYRVTMLVSGQPYAVYTDQISASITAPWLKFTRYALLNRTVTVADYSDVTRPARSGVFDVLGRRDPVAVTGRRGSARYTLTVLADTVGDADTVDTALTPGGVVFLQAPAGCTVPTGHYLIGDTTQARTARTSQRRVFTLPLTGVAAPAATITAVTATWETAGRLAPTWTALGQAYPTWVALAEVIGEPGDLP